MNQPSRFEIETLANEIFGAGRERRIRGFAQKETRVLAKVRSTGNIGGYLPALVKHGAECLRSEIIALADAWVESFTLSRMASHVWAETALETAALQMAGGTVSGIRGKLHLLARRTRMPIEDGTGHLEREITASKNGALREGKLRMKKQRVSFEISQSPPGRAEGSPSPKPTSRTHREGTNSISQLMSRIGRPISEEMLKAMASARLTTEDFEGKSSSILNRMHRMAGRMEFSAEEFRNVLPALLKELELEIPAEVLQPPPGKAGRPLSERTGDIHREWVGLGKPKVTAQVCDRLAKTFFQDELNEATIGSVQHRRVRERVRQAIRRSEQRIAT